MKIASNNDNSPNITMRILDEIAPQNPKKFIISDLPTIFPKPGSFGLWVKILKTKNKEKQTNNMPRKTFNNNNLKLP